jgi:hypothetical protein
MTDDLARSADLLVIRHTIPDGMDNEAGGGIRIRRSHAMPPVSKTSLAPFAALPTGDYCRASFASFLLSPFRHVDERVALNAAAVRAEREARLAATSVAAAARYS